MQPGRILVVVGLILVALGLLWMVAPRALSWFGNLPGDLRIERDGFRLYIPITSMLLLSALFSLLMWVLRR